MLLEIIVFGMLYMRVSEPTLFEP